MNIQTPIYCAFAMLLLAGCASDNNYGEERFLTEREQKSALAKTKSPQYYGFHAFPVQGGIEYRGYARLHPNHQTDADFLKGQPVIEIRGKSSRINGNALLDFSSPSSWMEFSTASEFGATFMGMNEDVIPYRGSFSGDVKAYAAVISQIRIDNLFMENVPLYVRMSIGGLGPFSRGIFTPEIDAVLGYDILGLYETIQLNLRDENVILSSAHSYAPHEELLMTQARIVPVQGYGLAVEGSIFGEDTPIVLDIAGDYHFMRGGANGSETKQVSIGDIVYRKVPTLPLPMVISNSLPRAGRRMLDKYLITICPRQGCVYFERYPEK
ncbi:hypothetical protein P4C99_18485 [Pontiellaceae bacterium B1224]|nr:hypothetical protein [Pontiellaceae bacterium B1224]